MWCQERREKRKRRKATKRRKSRSLRRFETKETKSPTEDEEVEEIIFLFAEEEDEFLHVEEADDREKDIDIFDPDEDDVVESTYNDDYSFGSSLSSLSKSSESSGPLEKLEALLLESQLELQAIIDGEPLSKLEHCQLPKASDQEAAVVQNTNNKNHSHSSLHSHLTPPLAESISTSSSTATLIREIQKVIDNLENSSIDSEFSESLIESLVQESQVSDIPRTLTKNTAKFEMMQDLTNQDQQVEGSAAAVAKTDTMTTETTAAATAEASTTVSNTPDLLTAMSSMSDGSGSNPPSRDGGSSDNNVVSKDKLIANSNLEAAQRRQHELSMQTSNHVYILHPTHSWIPARVLEKKSNTEFLLNIPEYANEQAIASDGGRSAKGFEKQVHDITKYPNNALPLQNVDAEGRLKEVEDMVDLPFLHEVRLFETPRIFISKRMRANGSSRSV